MRPVAIALRAAFRALVLACIGLPGLAIAQDLAFGPALSDGAVLQRGQPMTLTGTAAARAEVTITMGEVVRTALTDETGLWRMTLPAMPAGSGLTIEAASGRASVSLNNISIGDVFLCSGQSNMAFSMAEAALPPGERVVAIDRSISLLSVPVAQARVEQSDFARPAAWVNAHGASADFSAVCLIAGRSIARAQNVHVGLIDASMGGTPIESWLPYEGLRLAGNLDEGVRILDAFRADPEAAEDNFGASLDAMWIMPPPSGQAPDRPRMGYANLFNAMLAPLAHTRLAGVIWYQGENNTRRSDPRGAYKRQLQALLTSWRGRFGADLPFAIVQLAPFGPLSAEPGENSWSEVREAQRQVAEDDPLAELVTTVDVGERLDIHPPLKKPVGQRAAAALAHLVYGAPEDVLGPRPVSAYRSGAEILIELNGAGSGLMAASWGRPGPFQLCAQKAVPRCRFADARFTAQGIGVAVDPGFLPTHVRYCWGASPICNVFDREQRPLPPFEVAVRTDR